MVRIFGYALSALIIFLMQRNIFAADFLVINQIRGAEECCESGSLDLINAIQSENIDSPIAYALRYDAFSDERYYKALNHLDDLGILLEITPNLAADTGIAYRGNTSSKDWFLARNSMLIGYSIDERKLIIDHLFRTFRLRFGYFPKFSVSWMIDSWSLNYISRSYGILLHEITKEQYETDSYTLYGGIFNSPYYPSLTHPLLPGKKGSTLPVVMVRQTISDLVSNYGSPLARYTSQPNDYMGNYKTADFSYFRNLVDDTVKQKTVSFGIVGFENSYDFTEFGDEYIRQLKYLKSLSDSGEINLKSPAEFAKEFIKKNPGNPSFYLEKDFSNESSLGTLWYFGKNYRARLLKTGKKVILDDLRIYPYLEDPYGIMPSESDYSYYVLPYIFDGSQQYFKNKKISIEEMELIGNVAPDYLTEPFGIVLGETPFELAEKDEGISVCFREKRGCIELQPESFTMEDRLTARLNYGEKPDFIRILSEKKTFYAAFPRHPEFFIEPEKGDDYSIGWNMTGKKISLGTITGKSGNYIFSFPENIPGIEALNPIFQPDRSGLAVDTEKSVFYFNNRKAVAGRNPVMLFILPQNTLGRPVSINHAEITFNEQSGIDIQYPDNYSFRTKPWFVILSTALPEKNRLSLFIDGEKVVTDQEIEFVTDCSKTPASCMRNPVDLLKYIQVLASEKITGFKNKIADY